eukprot:s101_g17.t1
MLGSHMRGVLYSPACTDQHCAKHMARWKGYWTYGYYFLPWDPPARFLLDPQVEFLWGNSNLMRPGSLGRRKTHSHGVCCPKSVSRSA